MIGNGYSLHFTVKLVLSIPSTINYSLMSISLYQSEANNFIKKREYIIYPIFDMPIFTKSQDMEYEFKILLLLCLECMI